MDAGLDVGLLQCCGNSTGYKHVNLVGGLFYGHLPADKKHKRRKTTDGYATAKEAAREVARVREFKPGATCGCRACKADSTPPAPALTEQGVRAAAAAEGLTLAQAGTRSTEYKYIRYYEEYATKPFRINNHSLPAHMKLAPWPEHVPKSFDTPHEAALALARYLGPEHSAALAKEETFPTEEQIAACMECTENGQAYGGLFGGGFQCPRCFYDESGRKPCDLIYRSFGLACEGGRACHAGGWAEYGPRASELRFTEPVAQVADGGAKRGWGGRVFFWEAAGDDEGGGSSSSANGSYTHTCLFSGCGHKVTGFKQYGFLDHTTMDPLMNRVFEHEESVHPMPMTPEEVDEACYPYWTLWGIAVVHTSATPLAEPPSTPHRSTPLSSSGFPGRARPASGALGHGRSVGSPRAALCVGGRALICTASLCTPGNPIPIKEGGKVIELEGSDQNRSGYVGVSVHQNRPLLKRFYVGTERDGDKVVPGLFATAEEAALRRAAALYPELWAARHITK